MKRFLILAVAVSLIGMGAFMDPPRAEMQNLPGNHFVKGKVIAIESCYTNATRVSSTCLGVIETNGKKQAGKIMGDVRIDRTVYLECRTEDDLTACNPEWNSSVGELYLNGGEITQ